MPHGLQPRLLRKWRQCCPQWKPDSSWLGGLCYQQISCRQAQLTCWQQQLLGMPIKPVGYMARCTLSVLCNCKLKRCRCNQVRLVSGFALCICRPACSLQPRS